MSEMEKNVGFHLESSSQARFLPAFLAILVSLVLHGMAYHYLPALPMGQPPEVLLEPAPHTVHLHEVRPASELETVDVEGRPLKRPGMEDEIMEILETWTRNAPLEMASNPVVSGIPLSAEKEPTTAPDLP